MQGMSAEDTCPTCGDRFAGAVCISCTPAPDETVLKDSDTPIPWSRRKEVMDLLFQKTRKDLGEEISDYISIPEEARDALKVDGRRMNQYVFVEKVGEGGMGVVWKGWDLELARWVAIKILHFSDELSIRRFFREAQLSAQLRHPNIAAIHEVKQYEDNHYLAMDYIDGGNLREARLSLRESLEVFAKACRAVQFAHERSIIHRDIKPANIMLGKDGEPYVTDFGLAKILKSESSISASGTVMGSPVYMSPEQALGNTPEVDARSDIYSLGATLYTMLAGRPPFPEESIAQVLHQVVNEEPKPLRRVKADVPATVEAIVMKAMAKAKGDRYASAGELADDVEKYLRDETVSVRVPGSFTRAFRRIRQNPWPTVALVTILLAGGIVAGVVSMERKTAPRESQASFPREISFAEFDSALPELIGESRAVLDEMSDAVALDWIRDEVDEIPGQVWPKPGWLDRKPEAIRIREWCGALLEIIREKGAAYAGVREQLEEARNRFLAVAQYRGTVTLRIFITPFALLRDFSIGDERWLEDGKPVDAAFRTTGEGLSTPLILEGVEIGDYTLVLTHPDLGEHTIRVAGENLENGQDCLVAGSLDQPGSIRLRLP